MRKLLFVPIIISLLLPSLVPYTYAKDMTALDTDLSDYSISAFDLGDYPSSNKKALKLQAASTPLTLDYSLLNDVLTIEVSDADSAKDYSLIVVEYNNNDLPQKTHIINDVASDNIIGTVNGEYERAFLWDMDNMYAPCRSISTKTDYEIIEGKDGDWSVSPDGHTLYSYLGKDTDVIIPNSYRGKLIRTIYNQAAIANMTSNTTYAQISLFEGRTDITSFVISEGIAQLGPCAFSGCSASCELKIPKTLTYIGNFAFRGCQNLTGSLDLSNVKTLQKSAGQQFAFCSKLNGTVTMPSVETIPTAAFYECSKLTGGINLPSGVRVIDEYAFSCSSTPSFTSLTFPDTLEWIGKAAFQNQSRISNVVVLPDSLEHIADFAFNHCSSIANTTLTIPSSLKTVGGDLTDDDGNYTNTGYGGHVFYDSFKSLSRFEVADTNEHFKASDGVLYTKDGTRLVAYPPAKTNSAFIIPEGVTQIDELALGYSKFQTLTLPDSYVISETVPKNIINNKANTLAVAMYHYNNLKTVLVHDTNPNYVSINGIIYSADKTKLWYVAPKFTGEIVVSDNCNALMSGCCWMEYNNYSGELYTSISIPKSVTTIHANTLSDLNRKTNNSQTRFIINLDAENEYFTVNENGNIVVK